MSLSRYKRGIAYPDRQRVYPSQQWSRWGLTSAVTLTVQNTGLVPVLARADINGSNNANNTVGGLDIYVAILGAITVDGDDFDPDEILVVVPPGVPAEVQTGGTEYPAKKSFRGYVPANGGATGTISEGFEIRPGGAVQLQIKDLFNVLEYNIVITLEAVENLT